MEFSDELTIESIKEISNEKQYVCLICEDRFKYESQLRCHLTIHTDERAFQCLICHNQFKSKGNLSQYTQMINLLNVLCVVTDLNVKVI